METPNRLVTLPIPVAIWRSSLPLLFGLLTVASIPLVDSVYVSHYSTRAFNSLAMALPIMTLVSAFASSLAAAAGNAYARASRPERGNLEFTSAVTLALTSGLVLVAVALFGTSSILAWYRLDSSSELARGFSAYWRWILPTLPLYLLFGCLLQTLVARGETARANRSVAVLAAVNFAIDPVLIFGLDLGITGAAIAADIAYLAANLAAIRGLRAIPGLTLQPLSLRRLGKPIWRQLRTGFFIAAGTSAFLVSDFLFRRMAALEGPEAITAIGIADQLALVFIQVTRGIAAGIIPVAGAYLALNRWGRLVMIYWSGTSLVGIFYAVAGLLLIGAPALALGFFDISREAATADQVIFLQVTGATLLINVPARLLPPCAVALGRPQVGTFYSVTAVATCYLLAVWLVPEYSYVGIAWGRFFGFLLVNIAGIPYLFSLMKAEPKRQPR